MKTPDEHKVKFRQAMKRKGRQLACPFCGINYVSTEIGREVGEFIEVFTKNPETDQTLTETLSMVQLVCKSCGHVQLFDRKYLLA
jgi:transcription elongation factor Elf1